MYITASSSHYINFSTGEFLEPAKFESLSEYGKISLSRSVKGILCLTCQKQQTWVSREVTWARTLWHRTVKLSLFLQDNQSGFDHFDDGRMVTTFYRSCTWWTPASAWIGGWRGRSWGRGQLSQRGKRLRQNVANSFFGLKSDFDSQWQLYVGIFQAVILYRYTMISRMICSHSHIACT